VIGDNHADACIRAVMFSQLLVTFAAARRDANKKNVGRRPATNSEVSVECCSDLNVRRQPGSVGLS
jgi:hypothetical protein